MNRLSACALIVTLWAAIYLPGLGSTEIRGEEGRRILPAITMLETGNWLVPYVGGKPFLRKPPLVNWMIAASFRLTGVRNEWSARLPAVLCVLALALTIVATSGPGWLTPGTAFVAAIMAMTQFGLLAKARFAGAEIEGVYAPISGMAMVWWLANWAKGKSAWRTWLPAGALLGVACLAKGPSLHLLFFYAVVIAVLWQAQEWRWLWHPAHFAAPILAAGIFASWAVPYFQSPLAKDAAQVWKRQGIERFTDSEFNAGNYFTNLPRGLLDQLPWILFAPVAFGALRKNETPRATRLQSALRGAALAGAGCFALVLLIPGTLPRYVLPLGPVIALVLAWAVSRGRRDFLSNEWLAGIFAAVLAVALDCYFALVVPRLAHSDDPRVLARAIDAAMPPGEGLILYDPGYLPSIFYLRTRYQYAVIPEAIPAEAGWLLAREKESKKLLGAGRGFVVAGNFSYPPAREFLLLQRPSGLQKLRAR